TAAALCTAVAVLLLLVAATAAGAVLQRGAATSEARLSAELAAKQQELAATEQRIPGASQELAQLQELKGSKLESFEFKICNLGTRPMFVEWLHASWVGPEGAFEEFDSAFFGYETWEIAPGGTGKFGFVSGDEVVWDGKAAFVSALLSYGGEEFFRSGAVRSLGVDCFNLDLDR
ncbi:MAG TPA: hypothetical protein VHM02_13085, partial [Thermoanaerobaculia bacterium]|nr:hypothetical protein [Thermoanaerobaculia bacterium]